MKLDPFRDIEGRGSVDYVLRTLQQNYLELTQIADQKANIVIGLGVLIFILTPTLQWLNTGHFLPLNGAG